MEAIRFAVETQPRIRYKPQDLDLAVESVSSGRMNPTRAARVFGVPRQTIIYRLAKVKTLARPGPKK